MPRKRSEHKWKINFNIILGLFKELERLEKISIEHLESACIMYRNPIVFDNNTKSSHQIIGNIVSQETKYTNDHLIGMTNIVLYMYKNKIYKKWKTHIDFIQSLRSLQVLVGCPVRLNSIKSYKSDWLFNYENINKCIEWNKKLKNNGIMEIMVDNEMKDVDIIYNDWLLENKQFLF